MKLNKLKPTKPSERIASKSKQRISNAVKKRRQPNQVDYNANDIDQDRVKHSKLLTLVFEEASPLFKEQRQKLNDLAIKKCQPKKKHFSRSSKKAWESQSVVVALMSLEVKQAGMFLQYLLGMKIFFTVRRKPRGINRFNHAISTCMVVQQRMLSKDLVIQFPLGWNWLIKMLLGQSRLILFAVQGAKSSQRQ
jgi:hypothetical protein